MIGRLLCLIGRYFWVYSPIRDIRYCWRIGCKKKQKMIGYIWMDIPKMKPTKGKEDDQQQ